MPESPAPVTFPELVFGLAGPIGVDLNLVESILSAQLKQVNYDSTTIKLTDEMRQFVVDIPPSESEDLFSIYNWKMSYANALRKKFDSADTLARIAIKAIRSTREEMTGNASSPKESRAYIVRQLKRPEEVTLLRRIYGRQFVLVSAYAPETVRVNRLCDDLKLQLPTDTPSEDVRHKAQTLINRDASESEDPKLGQSSKKPSIWRTSSRRA